MNDNNRTFDPEKDPSFYVLDMSGWDDRPALQKHLEERGLYPPTDFVRRNEETGAPYISVRLLIALVILVGIITLAALFLLGVL